LFCFIYTFLNIFRFKICILTSFFAFNALVASLVASFAPAAPGIPICTNASVSLPTALCSAISSNGLILSKNCSTDAAVFVPAPKSINSAPSDTTPSGTLIKPDAIPATKAVAPDTSLSSSASGVKVVSP
jgi:hypothetical protein